MTRLTIDQEDSDLLDQCVAVYMTGARSALKIARVIARAELDDPKAIPSAEFISRVQSLKDTGEFTRRILWARDRMEKHIHQEALRSAPTALASVLWMASEKNPDKRTRTANAQFILAAAAGLSPTQKVDVSGGADLVNMCKEIFGKPKEAEPTTEGRNALFCQAGTILKETCNPTKEEPKFGSDPYCPKGELFVRGEEPTKAEGTD